MANENNKGNVMAREERTKLSAARIPKLRFTAFEGEWEEKRLGEISSKVAYGMNSAAIPFDGKHKYLRITDIDEDTREFIPSPLSSPDGLIEDKFKMKLNDIVFARTGASTGKSYLYNPKDGDLFYAGFLIKFNISKADSYFVYSQTFKESYRKWVQVFSMRSGQPGLNAEEYKNLKINLPTLPEQQKIAKFLTAVDTKLQQLNTKKELLVQYKKGVMQQLFSQQLRFKPDNTHTNVIASDHCEEQRDEANPMQSVTNETQFPDWEEKKLKEVISDFIVPMRDKPKELKGEIPWCRIEDFDGKYLYKSKSNQGVSSETIKKMNLKIYPINTLLVSCSANLGFCAIVKKELITNQTFIGLVPNSVKIDVDYLFHIMKLSSRRLNILSSGTTISYLSKKQFENFKINYPNLKEQQKIATFLSAIDAKIETVTQQIEHTQVFKKGLLQQMFV